MKGVSGMCAYRIVALFMALGIAGEVFAQTPDEAPALSVDVNRVMVYATVRQSNGNFVADLEKKDFTVLEDGKAQELLSFTREDVPVAIGLLVDNSRSMINKRNEVVEAAKAFVRVTNPGDEIFVLHFNEKLTYGLPKDTAFTSDHALLDAALDQMKLDGRTALYDAIQEGLQHLNRSTLTKKALIVLSDGGDNISFLNDDIVVKMADLSGALFYGIGIYDPLDGDADPGVLRDLAKRTGGEAYFPKALTEVRQLCETIAATLRNQYALSYSPKLDTPGRDYRKLEVKVRDPKRRKLTIRTRTGYYVSKLDEQK
jgi:Ca-activated chloride channel family protein